MLPEGRKVTAGMRFRYVPCAEHTGAESVHLVLSVNGPYCDVLILCGDTEFVAMCDVPYHIFQQSSSEYFNHPDFEYIDG